MKSIEERANEAYPAHEYSVLERVMKRGAYIRGAKEQQAIDEEVRLKKSDDMTKAEYDGEMAFADWYLKNGKSTPTFSDAIEWARKDVIDKACKYAKARYDLDYCGNVRDVLNYLKSLVEE